MGCVTSRPEFPNDVHPNVFTVTAISAPQDSRKDTATGRLEVTSDAIVLHRPGHDPTNWPLHFIRRYGFENHLFSFESGRRCESGPGIFTFRCRRARELFSLVQNNVQESRTPPPVLVNGNGALIRQRSGSAKGHNHFSSAPTFNSGDNWTKGSSNDYSPSATLRTTNSLTNNANSSFLHSISCSVGKSSATMDAAAFDGPDAGNTFEEVTPLKCGLSDRNVQRRNRLSSARSQASSVTSEHSLSAPLVHNQNPSQSRQISLEIVLSSSPSPQDTDSAALTSPRQSNPSRPPSPPAFPSYVNIQPQPRKIDSQRHLSAERYSNGAWKPPARSQSLNSPDVPDDGVYVNIFPNGESSSPSPRIGINSELTVLDYVTVDIGKYQPCTNSGRPSFFASSLTSVLHNLPLKNGNAKREDPSPVTNYAQIDYRRTKALRETAEAAQKQRKSTSCSASSSEMTISTDQTGTMGRRTRLDSIRTPTTEKSSISSQYKLFS